MNRSDAQARLMTMRSRSLLPTLLAAAALTLAGCGGDEDDDSDSNSGGSSENPAEEILADAGLEICSQEEEQIAQSTVGPDLQAIRSFDVAKDCGGSESSPNVIRVFQFGNRASVDQGAESAAAAYRDGVVLVSGALVIVATGPQREANADAVAKAYADTTASPVETVS
jgi:hypothetical protein